METLWPSDVSHCQVLAPASHEPRPLLLARHHVVPASWSGGPGELGPTITVCYACHTNIHVLIDDLVSGRTMRSRSSHAAYWAEKAMTDAAAAGATPARTL